MPSVSKGGQRSTCSTVGVIARPHSTVGLGPRATARKLRHLPERRNLPLMQLSPPPCISRWSSSRRGRGCAARSLTPTQSLNSGGG